MVRMVTRDTKDLRKDDAKDSGWFCMWHLSWWSDPPKGLLSSSSSFQLLRDPADLSEGAVSSSATLVHDGHRRGPCHAHDPTFPSQLIMPTIVGRGQF